MNNYLKTRIKIKILIDKLDCKCINLEDKRDRNYIC